MHNADVPVPCRVLITWRCTGETSAAYTNFDSTPPSVLALRIHCQHNRNPAQKCRKPAGKPAGSCKGGLVIHLLVPKCPSAFLLRRLSLADFADLPPKQRQAALSISLGRCVSPPVFLPAPIVEPLGCSLLLSFPSTQITSHTHSQWLSKKSASPTPAVSIPAASSVTFS